MAAIFVGLFGESHTTDEHEVLGGCARTMTGLYGESHTTDGLAVVPRRISGEENRELAIDIFFLHLI